MAGGADREEALRVTMRTAGRVVAFFSAVTVAAALAALIVFRQRFLYSMGVGGAMCALIAALVSLTLLPALLGTLGERVNAGGPRRWKEAIAREAAGRESRLLVPPLAARDAAAGAIRGGRISAADRTGAPVPAAGDFPPAWTRRPCPKDQTARIVDDAVREGVPAFRDLADLHRCAARCGSEADVRAFAARLPAPVEPPRVSSRAGKRSAGSPGRAA